MQSKSQVGQDLFPLVILKDTSESLKRVYLDIGCGQPVFINNTYLLEQLGWYGLCVDIGDYSNLHKEARRNPFVQVDVTVVDWESLLKEYDINEIDFMSFDVDDATIPAIEHFPFDKVICKTITIEHDLYRVGSRTQNVVRAVLERHGYVVVCSDVRIDGKCFEDWWVHSSIMNSQSKYVELLRSDCEDGETLSKRMLKTLHLNGGGGGSKKALGLILNTYHTEYMDFFMELLGRDYEIHVYIREDMYDVLSSIKHKCVVHDFFDFARNFGTREKYIVLSYSEEVYRVMEQYEHVRDISRFIFIVHNESELEKYRKVSGGSDGYLVLSRSLSGPRIVPIKNEIQDITKTDDTKLIGVMKLGWVIEDISHYETLLNLGCVVLVVFTQSWSKTLDELSERYPTKVCVYERWKTSDIKRFVTEKCIKFVFNPKDSRFFTGSISFALDHNMTLITQQEVIDYYQIPQDYAIAYDSATFTALNLYMKYMRPSDKNVLQTYKNKCSVMNKRVMLELMQ